MKALMLHSENSGVGYYRIWQQAKYLRQMGWDVPLLPDHNPMLPNDDDIGINSEDPELKKNFKEFGSWESLSRGSELLVYQRPDDPQTLAMAMAMREICDAPVVFEIDDNVFDVSKNSPSYKYWKEGSPYRDFAEMFMKSVDAITTTNEQLAEVYSKYNDNIYVLPNCQDLDDWDNIVRHEQNDQLVIGWAGSNTHYDDLHLIRRPLKKFLRNHPNAVLRLIGTWPDFLHNVKGVEMRKDVVGVRQWQSKLADLNFDIGLAPVVDRPFNQCKSNIKWQEYSMLEIPTIASRVGDYREIEQGETGYTAQTEQEWYYYLCKLADDHEHRLAIGRAAKQYTVENHNIASRIGEWDLAYRSIIDRYKSVRT